MSKTGKNKQWCRHCRKVSYRTQEFAAARAAAHGPTKVAYPCPAGDGYHYGESYSAESA